MTRCQSMMMVVLTVLSRSQDENRHGDFFTAVLKVQPQFLDDWRARAWSKFFCLSVYVTMYLNDHQRSAFYESLGLNTTQFNRCAPVELT